MKSNKKFKSLNQFEYMGLVELLSEAFPFVREQVCGTSHDGLINLQNTITENAPNDKFCLLGAFGLTEGHDIALEFWDYPEQDASKYYYITFRDARDWSRLGMEPFNMHLKKLD